MFKIFVDGKNGTTGLEIASRLEERKDVSLIVLKEEERKELSARLDAIASSDVTILCLPDAAAKEIVLAAKEKKIASKIIDASTAHRVDPSFAYGFPELSGQREKIREAQFVANPGCHASGFIALVRPLVEAGVIKKDACLSAYSLTGYTGGGKKMIAEYEADETDALLAPRPYGLTQNHKHLPEMKALSGLSVAPAFIPVVSSYPRGMLVSVPLFASEIEGDLGSVKAIYKDYYQSGVVRYEDTEEAFLSSSALAGRDDMVISAFGNEERILLTATFDNLGKGASGAAVQNMNLMLGIEETTGLKL